MVEDDEILSGIVSRYLRARGYRIDVAPDAEDATDRLDRGLRPALVLLDIDLPGDSGWSLVGSDALRRGGSPPVVLVTAANIDMHRLNERGVTGLLPKPFALETLVSLVDRYVDRSPDV